MIKYLLTIIYIILTTFGITLLKLGGENGFNISLSQVFSVRIGYLALLGFVCYLFSFLLWQKLLVIYDLSYIVPITTGIVQIIILLIGHFVFNENINLISVCGVIIIIIGIVMTAYGKLMK